MSKYCVTASRIELSYASFLSVLFMAFDFFLSLFFYRTENCLVYMQIMDY